MRNQSSPHFLAVHLRKLMAAVSLSLLGLALLGSLELPQQAQAQEKDAKNFSPYANRNYATNVYWGDQHQHTSFSPDAGLVGDKLTPDDAFRFARGEQLRSSTGQLVQLERPYDWLVVADHATYYGLPQAFQEMDPDILKTATGKNWAEALKKGARPAMTPSSR
jgi:hypothetical protein